VNKNAIPEEYRSYFD